ncbi:hypothetical protein PG997_014220 [Apiospora hydei]|uniref:SPRY domain-containing protein n=1 Tax=Apiospora hydei TaxID=1337664 RepID=A0ABR1UT62_9PEZI
MLIKNQPEAAKADTELQGICAMNGSIRLLEQLYNLGADLYRQDRYGWTPLELAQIENQIEVEFLDLDHPSSTIDVDDISNASSSYRTNYNSNYRNIDNKAQKQYLIVAIGLWARGIIMCPSISWPSAPSARSWAYFGDDGGFFSASETPTATWLRRGPPYGLAGDTVGCGVDFGVGKQRGTATIWFTHNGQRVKQHEFTDVQGRLWPVLGLKHAVKLETRFRGPFLYKGAGAGGTGEEENGKHDGQGLSVGAGDS